MNYPIVCEFCGSGRLRRSRWRSKLEMVRSALGSYPFRCQDCHGRFYVNIFLISRLAYAKCPKCLSLDISNSKRTFHPSLFKKLMLTFGARRCRCNNCRFMFVSFRPLPTSPLTESEIEEEMTAQPDVAVKSEPETRV